MGFIFWKYLGLLGLGIGALEALRLPESLSFVFRKSCPDLLGSFGPRTSVRHGGNLANREKLLRVGGCDGAPLRL